MPMTLMKEGRRVRKFAFHWERSFCKDRQVDTSHTVARYLVSKFTVHLYSIYMYLGTY